MGNEIKQFEDLECWQEARVLVKMVYELTKSPPISKDFGFKEQLQRSSISIMANIAEGFDTFSNQEFIRFLRIALCSCSETQSHLYAALDIGYLNQETFEKIFKQTKKCSNYIKAFLRYLKEK